MIHTIKTIDELTELYKSVFYLEDSGIIPLVCAVIISNRADGDPVWLMLIGPSSGGKSEAINATLGLPFVHQISTLTSNTFLSGMTNNTQETSLLHEIGSGVIAMKDFTTILSIPRETQAAIMGQLREIFDGHLTKRTGTGKNLNWKGKINLLAGCTEKINLVEGMYAEMGTRWVNYILASQDRKLTTQRALDNNQTIHELREKIQEGFTEYIYQMIDKLPEEMPPLPEQVMVNIIEVADFSSEARSPVQRNYKGEMTFVLSSEMPMRLASQLKTLGHVFICMNDYKTLRGDHEKILYKIALDSIPKVRRQALQILAKYDKITTAGLASELNFPTATARMWLEDLNARGMCKRGKQKKVGGDEWSITNEHRFTIRKYDYVKHQEGKILEADSDYEHYEDIGDPSYGQELSEKDQKFWNSIPKEKDDVQAPKKNIEGKS